MRAPGLSRPRSSGSGPQFSRGPTHWPCRAPTYLPSPRRVQWEGGENGDLMDREGGGPHLRAWELRDKDPEEGSGGPRGPRFPILD